LGCSQFRLSGGRAARSGQGSRSGRTLALVRVTGAGEGRNEGRVPACLSGCDRCDRFAAWVGDFGARSSFGPLVGFGSGSCPAPRSTRPRGQAGPSAGGPLRAGLLHRGRKRHHESLFHLGRRCQVPAWRKHTFFGKGRNHPDVNVRSLGEAHPAKGEPVFGTVGRTGRVLEGTSPVLHHY
jgi:hypothetical protein